MAPWLSYEKAHNTQWAILAEIPQFDLENK